jgi:hypothetical protein
VAGATAQATVRVWTTESLPLTLGYGLMQDRPRVDRARRDHRHPLRGGSGFRFLPKQEKHKGGETARSKYGLGQTTCGSQDGDRAVASGPRPFPPARYARLREGARPRGHSPKQLIGEQFANGQVHGKRHINEHVRVASCELPWENGSGKGQPQRGCGLAQSAAGATPLGLGSRGAVHPG